MRRKYKHLSEEDRILWSRVARTAVPLPGKALPQGELAPQRASVPMPPPAAPMSRPKDQPPAERHPRRLDAPTREKLSNGRIGITGRVDLHGLTQEEAHMLLLSFLQRAYDSGRRYVLVITGKGSTGHGVLRRAVPQWLSTSPFSAIVSGYEEAARQHGGAGALYVRLRRSGPRR